MNKEEILELIKSSLEKLYERDRYLIYHSDDNHNSERAVVFRFGVYFDQEVKNRDSNSLRYNVDVEYNRNIDDIKGIRNENKNKNKKIIPDLIWHQRGDNENNMLIIEFKTWWNNNQDQDIDKIKKFCDPNGEYKYKYGATILLGKRLDEIEIKLFASDNNNREEDFTWQDLQNYPTNNQ